MTDKKLVEDLCEIDHGMTEWEVEFVESIARQVLDDKHALSKKQRDAAKRILEERG